MSGKRTDERGSALLSVMILVVVMTGLIWYLLADSAGKMRDTVGLVEASQSFQVAEGGLDRAVADLNAGGSGCLGTSAWIPGSHDWNGNGRPDFGEPNVTEISLGTSRYFTHAVNWFTDGVDNDGLNGPDDAGEEGYFTIVAAGVEDSQSRYGASTVIEAILFPKPTSIFNMAMFGDAGVTLNGTIFTDSYDSAVGTYASQATNVHPVTGKTYAKANGDVGSNKDISANGTADIYGSAVPGPDGAVFFSGGVFIAGSTTPNKDPVTLEPPVYAPPIPSGGAFKLPGGSPTLLTAGQYRFDSLQMNASEVLKIQGEVDLYIDGDMLMAAQAAIEITPGAKLNVYHGTGNVQLAGNGLVNTSKVPRNFVLKSSTTGTVKLAGNADFYGGIYAPLAFVNPVGTSLTFGALVGKKIQNVGTADFHYDEDLARIRDPKITYIVRSWREIR